jgi:hypothetical protein
MNATTIDRTAATLTPQRAQLIAACATLLFLGSACTNGANANMSSDATHQSDAMWRGGEHKRRPCPPSGFCSSNPNGIKDGHGNDTCIGGLADKFFGNAICTCNDISASGCLTTDTFDGTGKAPAFGPGGSVGVNGTFHASQAALIGGSVVVNGTDGVQSDVRLEVRQNLADRGPLQATGPVSIDGNALVGGNAEVDTLQVGGQFVMTPGTTLVCRDASECARPTGGEVRVPNACDCDPAHQLDVPGIVEAQRKHNDNGQINLSPDAKKGIDGSHKWEVPCGRFFVDEISGKGNLVIRADGRLALFVGGDIDFDGDVTIRAFDDADLDVFVKGNVNITGKLRFGNLERPAHARLWVGGTQVNVGGDTELYGNLYAPHADVKLSGKGEVFGATFSKSLHNTDSLKVHYDKSNGHVGGDCKDPNSTPGNPNNPNGTPGNPNNDQPCSTCGDCANGGTCIEGQCMPCGPDAACCSGLTCDEGGRCVPETPPPPPPECGACGDCPNGGTCITGKCMPCGPDAACCAGLTCDESGRCVPETPPPPACAGCGDCPNLQTCIAEVCRPCGPDAPCCSGLLCIQGQCVSP